MYYSFYKDKQTGEIISREILQQKFSHISLPPHPWDKFVYDFLGVSPMIPTDQPPVDEFHIAVDKGYSPNEDGYHIQQWEIVSKFKNTAEEENYKKELVAEKWTTIREERNRLLTETDYTQFANTPIDSTSQKEFEIYRQQLRDITNQSSPYEIQWPKKPQYIGKK